MIDLARVVSVVKLIAEQGHWALLESLDSPSPPLPLAPAPGELRARIDALTIRIRKPVRTGPMPPRRGPAPQQPVVYDRAARSGPGVAADVISETRYTTLLRVRLTKGAR